MNKLIALFAVTLIVTIPFVSKAMTVEDLSFQLSLYKKEGSVLGASTDGINSTYNNKSLSTDAPKVLFKGLKFTEKGSSMVIKKNLSFGNKGSEEVKKLQIFLNATGDLNSDATGYFGPKTKEALKKFQIRKGIKGGDGNNVGPLTRKAISEQIEIETKE